MRLQIILQTASNNQTGPNTLLEPYTDPKCEAGPALNSLQAFNKYLLLSPFQRCLPALNSSTTTLIGLYRVGTIVLNTI